MLSYDWIKMVLVAAAIIVAWTLIFTMTATRITPAQQYTVFNYEGNRPFNTFLFSFAQFLHFSHSTIQYALSQRKYCITHVKICQ